MTRILEALDFSRPVQPLFAQPTRAGYIHSIFPGALNIAVDEALFTLLSDEKPRMPSSVRLPRCIMEQLYSRLSAGVQVRVGDGKFSLPILDLSIHLPDGEAWEPVPRVAAHSWRSPSVSARIRELARYLAQRGQQDGLAPLVRPLLLGEATQETPLGRIALPLLRLLVQGCREPDMEKVEQAARGLAGLGPGLTPSGDDTLGGFIGVLVLVGAQAAMDAGANKRLVEAIANAARPRTTLLSATLLAHMARGEMAEQVGELLMALTLPPEAGAQVLQAAERVLAYGASSGGDTLLGLLLGLQVTGNNYAIDDNGEGYGDTGAAQTQYLL